jgi:putative ABC transport system substrate-binding protein
MNGRLLQISITALLLILGLCFSVPVCATEAEGQAPIAILLSDSEEAYTKPVATFSSEIGVPVHVFDLKGDVDNAPARMAEILAIKPALIFALGAKAAFTAKVWTADTPEIPVIFAMVLNWERYGLLDGQPNVAGIASEVDPGTQFINLTIALPDVKRVGVVYSKTHSAETVVRAKREAGRLGLELVELPINRPKEFRQTYKQIADKIDGYWMLADPVVYTLENVAWLEERCTRDRIACIGPSRNIAEMGILLAVNADVSNIGIQAASIAKSILLRRLSPKQIGVMPPLGTRLVLNAKTAERIGITFNRTALDMASDVIDN